MAFTKYPHPAPMIHYNGLTDWPYDYIDNSRMRQWLNHPVLDEYYHQYPLIKEAIEKAIDTCGGNSVAPKRIFGLLKTLEFISPKDIAKVMNANRTCHNYKPRYINRLAEMCRRSAIFINEAMDADHPYFSQKNEEMKLAEYLKANGVNSQSLINYFRDQPF